MTQIKGTQILAGSAGFEIFPTNEAGVIVLPQNIVIGDKAPITSVSIQVATKVEKVEADSAGNYIVSALPAGDVMVMVNGVVQAPGDDYTMDGQTINFTSAPSSDDKVVASYIVFAQEIS